VTFYVSPLIYVCYPWFPHIPTVLCFKRRSPLNTFKNCSKGQTEKTPVSSSYRIQSATNTDVPKCIRINCKPGSGDTFKET